MIRAALPVALLGLLAGCDGGGDPVQQALRDTSAANHAAAARTTAEAASRTAAASPTRDQAYVARMIAHHEDAVAMARAALRDSRDPEIRRMAQSVVDTQTREIAEMKAWTPTARPAN